MTYFSNLPYTSYELDGDTTIVKNILVRSKFISEYAPYTDLYELYAIDDGETVQSIANSYYGSSSYYWVIMMFNEFHDVNTEWPLNFVQFNKFVEDKYGVYRDSIMYWVNQDDLVCGEVKNFSSPWTPPENPGVPGNLEYTPVTFTEHEEKINNKKRIIKLMRVELLSDFVSQFRDSLNG
jgi:hypothetical protein